MDASVLTLGGCRNFLPYLLRNAAKEDFFVQKANDILSEIEEKSDPRYLSKQKAILLREGATRYNVGSGIRDIRGIYGVDSGCVEPDTDKPIYFETLDGVVVFKKPFSMSGDADISGTASATTASTIQDNAAFGDLAKDSQKGRLIRVTSSSPAFVQDRIIAGNEPEDDEVSLNGDLSPAPESSTGYLITSDFLIMEYVPYFTRLESFESLIGLSKEFESLFITGLTYKLHMNSDESSQEAREWKSAYEMALGRYAIRNNTMRPDAPPARPRYIPTLF